MLTEALARVLPQIKSRFVLKCWNPLGGSSGGCRNCNKPGGREAPFPELGSGHGGERKGGGLALCTEAGNRIEA